MPHMLSLYVFGVIALIHPLRAQAPSQPVPEYSNGALEMTVEHAKPERGLTREGEDLYGILTIRLKNASDEKIPIIVGNPDCDFAIDIRDSSGNPPKLTALGERLLPKSETEREVCPVIGVQVVDLRPEKELKLRWYINRLFELEPGKPYSVKVTWAKGLPAKTPCGRPLRQQLFRTLTVK
jgi:hypothetical protein